MLTDRRNNLISLAARNSLKKPTSTIPVASIILPATVMKSNVFHASLKYGCKIEMIKNECILESCELHYFVRLT